MMDFELEESPPPPLLPLPSCSAEIVDVATPVATETLDVVITELRNTPSLVKYEVYVDAIVEDEV